MLDRMSDAEVDDVAALFRLLADIDFPGASPLWERLTREAADDREVVSLLLPAAPADRLPHLLLAAVQYVLLGDGSDPLVEFEGKPASVFTAWCVAHRDAIEQIVATHVVQTNEVGRCAGLLPCLAHVAQRSRRPLALVEVGASAGLNLHFDCYRYDFGSNGAVGPAASNVVLRPRVEGVCPSPLSIPSVAWRCGIDRRPVDITDDDEVRWLRACIWPEQRERIERLEHAVTIARRDRPTIVKGDVFEALPKVVADVPRDAALCIAHTAVLGYVTDGPGFRRLLGDLARERPVWWVSGEAQGTVEQLTPPSPPPAPTAFVYGVVPLGVDGEEPRALVRAGSHGSWIEWLDPHR
jgi:hypothetical protein